MYVVMEIEYLNTFIYKTYFLYDYKHYACVLSNIIYITHIEISYVEYKTVNAFVCI